MYHTMILTDGTQITVDALAIGPAGVVSGHRGRPSWTSKMPDTDAINASRRSTTRAISTGSGNAFMSRSRPPNPSPRRQYAPHTSKEDTMHSLYGWWCPGCHAWKTRDDIRQVARDGICLEECVQCGSIVEDRRFTTFDKPSC
jgi:hypothetical protein